MEVYVFKIPVLIELQPVHGVAVQSTETTHLVRLPHCTQVRTKALKGQHHLVGRLETQVLEPRYPGHHVSCSATHLLSGFYFLDLYCCCSVLSDSL